MVSRVPTILRAARTASGLTQADLARRLRTTQSAIARLEAQGSNPTIGTLERALIASGHRLEIATTPALPPVDEEQIASRLRMAPAERLASHTATRQNLRELVRKARAPVDAVG
jgi:transcriptional regulator with XRE-family HTH domain